jgi:hypothetical protein
VLAENTSFFYVYFFDEFFNFLRLIYLSIYFFRSCSGAQDIVVRHVSPQSGGAGSLQSGRASATPHPLGLTETNS